MRLSYSRDIFLSAKHVEFLVYPLLNTTTMEQSSLACLKMAKSLQESQSINLFTVLGCQYNQITYPVLFGN